MEKEGDSLERFSETTQYIKDLVTNRHNSPNYIKIQAIQFMESIDQNSIVNSFLQYLKIALVFDTCYTDWFLIIIRRTHKPAGSLISSYMDEKLVMTSNQDKLFFYITIQLLSFARTCQLK